MLEIFGFLGRALIVVGCTVAMLTGIFSFGTWVFTTTTTFIMLGGVAVAFVGGYLLFLQES